MKFLYITNYAILFPFLISKSSSDKLKPEFVIGNKEIDISPEDLEKIQKDIIEISTKKRGFFS